MFLDLRLIYAKFILAASELIGKMLTVSAHKRINIEQICCYWWVNDGYQETCLAVAEELAAQTPVRLDLLLSLAPPPEKQHFQNTDTDKAVSQTNNYYNNSF